MSGIYVPDIEMPDEEQSVITVNIYSDGVVYCYDDNAERTAFPVLDHGRMIDADALEKWLIEWYDLKADLSIAHFLDILKDETVAPTIIPADKEYE